jgi:hypothetical protein
MKYILYALLGVRTKGKIVKAKGNYKQEDLYKCTIRPMQKTSQVDVAVLTVHTSQYIILIIMNWVPIQIHNAHNAQFLLSAENQKMHGPGITLGGQCGVFED